MFTPPPSPRPPNSQPIAATQTNTSSLAPPIIVHAMSSHDQKQRTGRRFRWAVLIVPFVLILITASTQYLTHPAAFDIISSSPPREWSQLVTQARNWRLHKRHPSPIPENTNNSPSPPPSPSPSTPRTSSTTSSTVPSQVSAVSPSIPTIPSAPPVLPTPFPQPFDPQLTANFSSNSCLSFFFNMTNSNAFRPCRAFSLLSQSSADFINAQSNLTLMNTLIWGTCNTNPGVNQCIANMGWFASTLKTECEDDLKDQNSLAVETLIALNAYNLMHYVACMPDPLSNTYCYIDAVAETAPADLYLYQLPLGISLPTRAANFSCSSCPKNVLANYASTLSNETLDDSLTGLKETYEGAAQILNSFCGADFARAGVVNGALRLTFSFGTVIFATLLLVWTLIL